MDEQQKVFGPAEEIAVISLIFDKPEFVSTIIPYLDVRCFEKLESQIIFSKIKEYFEKHSVIPTRGILADTLKKEMKVEDPFEEILIEINRKSNPREVPHVMNRLVDWARNKTLSKLYLPEALEQHEIGEYGYVEKILEEARKISEFNTNFWYFFDNYKTLYDKLSEQKLTSGFETLDQALNEGGPIRGDCLCFMAPTGTGKSIALCNTGTATVLRELNTLHVTMEMSTHKTALRYLGNFTNEWIRARFYPKTQARMTERLEEAKLNYGNRLVIVEYPPDDISVDQIHSNIDTLRRLKGINIDVVIIDYLELLLPRRTSSRDDEYDKQKRVATELCRLAKKENVLVVTAMQTNRGGNDIQGGGEKVVDLNKVAESYGKTMPMDYIVSINQSKEEYDAGKSDLKKKDDMEIDNAITNARVRFYVAKNRNGPKFGTIYGEINYETMKIKEIPKPV